MFADYRFIVLISIILIGLIVIKLIKGIFKFVCGIVVLILASIIVFYPQFTNQMFNIEITKTHVKFQTVNNERVELEISNISKCTLYEEKVDNVQDKEKNNKVYLRFYMKDSNKYYDYDLSLVTKNINKDTIIKFLQDRNIKVNLVSN